MFGFELLNNSLSFEEADLRLKKLETRFESETDQTSTSQSPSATDKDYCAIIHKRVQLLKVCDCLG